MMESGYNDLQERFHWETHGNGDLEHLHSQNIVPIYSKDEEVYALMNVVVVCVR